MLKGNRKMLKFTMTVQFEHDERDTENNIDINKIKKTLQ